MLLRFTPPSRLRRAAFPFHVRQEVSRNCKNRLFLSLSIPILTASAVNPAPKVKQSRPFGRLCHLFYPCFILSVTLSVCSHLLIGCRSALPIGLFRWSRLTLLRQNLLHAKERSIGR